MQLENVRVVVEGVRALSCLQRAPPDLNVERGRLERRQRLRGRRRAQGHVVLVVGALAGVDQEDARFS